MKILRRNQKNYEGVTIKQCFVFLVRHTEKNTVRYYKLGLYPTLFNNFEIEIEYGNIQYKAPTGRKREFFDNYNDAYKRYNNILKQKRKKGYK